MRELETEVQLADTAEPAIVVHTSRAINHVFNVFNFNIFNELDI